MSKVACALLFVAVVEAADKNGRVDELHAQLVDLAKSHNQSETGTMIPATFLRVTVSL